MRIDNNNLTRTNSPASGVSQRGRAANNPSLGSAAPGQGGTKADEVQLSNVAGRVGAKNLSLEHSLSAERSGRVDQLTQLVQSGKYHPDPKQVADSMIRDMLSGTRSY